MLALTDAPQEEIERIQQAAAEKLAAQNAAMEQQEAAKQAAKEGAQPTE